MEKLTHILKEEQPAGGEDKFIDRIAERVDTFLDSNSLAVLIALALVIVYCGYWGTP